MKFACLLLAGIFLSCGPKEKPVPVWEQENRWPHVNDFKEPFDTARVRLTDRDLLDALEKRPASTAEAAALFRTLSLDAEVPAPDDTAAVLAQARRFADNRITFYDVTASYGDSLDWLYNPTRDSTGHYNKEWSYKLFRCYHWEPMLQAFQVTGDRRTIDKITGQLFHFRRRFPRPKAWSVQDDSPLLYNFPVWNTLNVAVRSGNTWLKAFQVIRKIPDVPDSVIVEFVKGFYDHALYLEKYHMYRNWLIAESAALYKMGILLSPFKKAAGFRKTALARLAAERDRQYYPDGLQYELAPGYHGFTLNLFIDLYLEVRESGFPLPFAFIKPLEKAYEYPVLVQTPGGRVPEFNDTDRKRGIEDALNKGLEVFPQNPVLQFGKRRLSGSTANPPGGTSIAFEYGGQYVMRTDWSADALYLAADFGPYGMGHQHEDKLSFVLYAYGKELIAEGGIYAYNYFSRWRKYMSSSLAHNTVLVDGMSQARLARPWPKSWRTDGPLDNVWMSTGKYDYLRGTYDEGYMPFDMPEKSGFMDEGVKSVNSARHTRQILFVKPGYWIIIDDLESLDGKSHDFEALFHLAGPRVRLTGNCFVTEDGAGPNVALYAPTTGERSVAEGIDGKVIRGWMPARDSVAPAPVARHMVRGVKMRNCYVIVPFRGNENPVSACTVSDDGTDVTVVIKDGTRDRLRTDEKGRLGVERSGKALFRIRTTSR